MRNVAAVNVKGEGREEGQTVMREIIDCQLWQTNTLMRPQCG